MFSLEMMESEREGAMTAIVSPGFSFCGIIMIQGDYSSCTGNLQIDLPSSAPGDNVKIAQWEGGWRGWENAHDQITHKAGGRRHVKRLEENKTGTTLILTHAEPV
jgi:hypothetical protein